jgi:acyl-CoA dehydrogenase
MYKVSEEHEMLRELVKKFVRNELMPLEKNILDRFAAGQPAALSDEENQKLFKQCKELGLWALDVPEEAGGANLPAVALVGVNEELGYTAVPFTFPPDSPNLHMMLATVTPEQRKKYLEPYAAGETTSAIAISEPGAGGDPAGMKTKAVKDGDHWVINGRKIWISRIAKADFTIVMAVTDSNLGARGGITAFLVDKGTKGLVVARAIPMLAGQRTYPFPPPTAPTRSCSRIAACMRARCWAASARASHPCSCASPCAACRWARGASAWRSARSTCWSSTPTSA